MPYVPTSARILPGRSQKRIVHIWCQHCEHSLLFSVTLRQNGVVCAGIFTDCEYEDAKRLLFGDKISVDDVISVHAALQFDNFLEMR